MRRATAVDPSSSLMRDSIPISPLIHADPEPNWAKAGPVNRFVAMAYGGIPPVAPAASASMWAKRRAKAAEPMTKGAPAMPGARALRGPCSSWSCWVWPVGAAPEAQ